MTPFRSDEREAAHAASRLVNLEAFPKNAEDRDRTVETISA